MKHGDLLKSISFKEHIRIDLDSIYPIQPLDENDYQVKYLINDEEQTLFEGVFYANQLEVSSKTKSDVSIYLGEGYLTEKADQWTHQFITDDIWQGGDGIFSFNLTDGLDCFDQDKEKKTLFVFGDSFIGRFDQQTQKRLEPHLMPNNTFAYLDDGTIEFKIDKGVMGDVKAFYELPERYDFKGPIARNLVTYYPQKDLEGYLSAYDPKDDIEIIFDLYDQRHITKIVIENYFSEQLDELAKRGMKSISLFGTNDLTDWHSIKEFELKMSKKMYDAQRFIIDEVYRYFKLVCKPVKGIGNYNDEAFDEGLYGLNKIKFYSNDQYLKDIEVVSNSVMRKESEHGWLWLQDGVVIKDYLYFLPLIVGPDASQPEGLQFKVMGVNMFKTPIHNQSIEPKLSVNKFAPVFAYDKDSNYFFGAGIMANTKSAGQLNPDGYIYIYGYKTTYGLREMIVARVKEDRFEYFDDWEYYALDGYSSELLDSKPILEHISCEMSVSEIKEGKNKGRFIAVFSYDVDSPYVAFALGDSPVGPFTKAQKVYHTPEQAIFKSTTYTYNAKAHPHLSQSQKILVSYNTNTYNFDHNMSNRLIYKPRFIYLNEI